ncbi:reverse transcriptase domain-containing protein [Tanacetum coccineum]
MLGEHNITYQPRTSVKGQILTDFLVEKSDKAPPDTSVVETPQESWTLFTDGSSCIDGSEYEALIAYLRIATQMGVRNVHVSVDSKLVVNQVLGTYVAKEENMIKYLKKAKSLVLVEVLKEKSIQEKEVATVVEEDGPTWMTSIIEYLKDGTLPDDRKDASKLCIKARQYELLEGVLYRRSFLKPWLRTTVRGAKSMRLGYYWPTMHWDARDTIHKCKDFQIHRPVPRNSQQLLTPITTPWPFYKWGIDIAGPFPEGPGKVKFLIVAMNYFTKWIEANALAIITGSQMKKFVWDNIVCHFGLPGEIISDNEGVIPAEIRMPTYRTAVVYAVHNDEELRLNLDLLEERRERAAICETKAKLKMTKYYNARVQGVTFRPRDYVYRSNHASHVVDGGRTWPKVGRTL